MNIIRPLLENIETPDDLKKLDAKKLPFLCEEIREALIGTVSKNGGHLASNLGVVELTVALHRAFDAPSDKIIFDVGHQCYTHKILTGRYDKINTIRQKNGLSGFPRPFESKYDAFSTGHSSTSISAAYGISEANRLAGNDNYAIAVIGDGSFSGGLAYEAMNNAGRGKNKLIVILNDNKMSISRNVGSMARHLAIVRSKKGYYRFKEGFEKILLKIPFLGKKLRNFIVKSKLSIKNILYHSTIFENMGFMYMGPVDGHNLNTLSDTLEAAKTCKQPVIIHIMTKKGKGYEFAEKKPSQFHGIPKFDIETGDYITSEDSFSYNFGKILCDMAEKDEKICAITAAMTEGTGLSLFREKYKDRFYDVGIAEQHAITFACGLAISGMKPVFAVYSSFLQRGYDQIIHDAAIQNLNIVIAVDRAGFVGEDGETHQGIFDVSFLNAIPNVTIYSPSTYSDLKTAMKKSLANDAKGVQIIRYPRGSACNIKNYKTSNKKIEVLGDKNSEYAAVTYGRIFGNVYPASKNLPIKIIKLNCIKPISKKLIEELINHKKIFFFEEGMKSGGISEKISVLLYENGYSGKIKINAIKNEFISHASVDELLAKQKLDTDSIRKLLKEETNAP